MRAGEDSFQDAAKAAVEAGFAAGDEAIVVGGVVIAALLEFGGVGLAVEAPLPNVTEDAVEADFVGGGFGDRRSGLRGFFKTALREVFEFLARAIFLPLFDRGQRINLSFESAGLFFGEPAAEFVGVVPGDAINRKA